MVELLALVVLVLVLVVLALASVGLLLSALVEWRNLKGGSRGVHDA